MHGHTEILTEVQGDKEYTEMARFKEAYEDNNSSKEIVERKMREDNEATSVQRYALVCSGYTLTLKRVLRCRSALGWTFRGSAYSQLICQETKQSVCSGHSNTEMTTLQTSFGLTSVWCKWKVTVSFVAASAVKHQRQSQGT